MRSYYVYLLTNTHHNVLYVGITNDLERRVYEHKMKRVKGFTQKYNVDKLVYVEETGDVNAAIAREKQIKGWARKKKNALIDGLNPHWNDLGVTLAGDPSAAPQDDSLFQEKGEQYEAL